MKSVCNCEPDLFFKPQYLVKIHFFGIPLPMRDYCPEPGKIKALKMLDLQTKSAIDSDNMRV